MTQCRVPRAGAGSCVVRKPLRPDRLALEEPLTDRYELAPKGYDGCMRDVVFVAIVIGFFGIAAAYVRACAAIIGPDELVSTPTPEDEDAPEVGVGER